MNIIKRNNVKVYGNGDKAMIFANGFGCGQEIWRLVAPAFEGDYQTILFDHVGAGSSDTASYNRSKYSSLQGYADDVLEICEKLDLKDTVFVGHSVSTMIGVLAAIKSPTSFSRLVMIGPSPCYINDGTYQGGFEAQSLANLLKSLENNYQEWAKNMAPVIMGSSHNPDLGLELARSFCKVKPEIAEEFARVTFLSDLRDEIENVSVKSLILQCSDDAIAPESVGRYLHEHMKESKFNLLRATGHCPHLSAPSETIQAMKSFLKKAA